MKHLNIDLASPNAPRWKERGEELRAMLSRPDQDSITLSGVYRLTSPLVVCGKDCFRIDGGGKARDADNDAPIIIVDVGPGQIGIHFDCDDARLLNCSVVVNVLPGTGKCDGVRLSGDCCSVSECNVYRVGDPRPRLYALHACRSRFARIEWCYVDLGVGPGYGPQLTDGVGGVITDCSTTRFLPPGHGIGYDTHPAGIVGGAGHQVRRCEYVRQPGDKSGAAFRVNGYLDGNSMNWARECAIVDCSGAPTHLENVDGLYERGCDVAKAINVVGRVTRAKQ